MVTATSRILYCHCSYGQVLPNETRRSVLEGLCRAGVAFEAVPDLCALCARRGDGPLPRMADGPAKIVACHPRAVRWLLAAAEIDAKATSVEFLNLRLQSANEVLAALIPPTGPAATGKDSHDKTSALSAGFSGGDQRLSVILDDGPGGKPLDAPGQFHLVTALLDAGYAVSCAGSGGLVVSMPTQAGTPSPPAARRLPVAGLDAAGVLEAVDRMRTEIGLPKPGQWLPWFPVIDSDRCDNCMQCLSFCLFGVFGVDAGKRIAIENSRSCKANCPACSRVCPESAIMFPKHRGGAISGEPVRDAGPEREKMKVDISALLGGDIFSTLRDRSERAKHRFSKDRNPDEAIEERRRCLAAAGLLGDVPPEALASLPSIEEMQRRAGEAKARARAALSNRPSPPQTSP